MACDHNKEIVWKLPVLDGRLNNRELHETIKRGMFVEIFDARIWCEPLWKIKMRMETDNQDQVGNMSDHEFHIGEQINSALVALADRSKKSLWEAVWAVIGKTNLSTFNRRECGNLYELLRTLGEEHWQT